MADVGQRHREESTVETEYEWCAVNEWGHVRISCETEAEARDVVANSTTHAGGRVQRRVKPVAIEWEDVPRAMSLGQSERRLAVDADGFVWWVHADGTHSMARTNPDNEPTPMPFTFYVPVSEVEPLRQAIARLMRHQANLADLLDLGEGDIHSAELVASRDEAKRALGR